MSETKPPGDLLQRAARMLASTRRYGYQVGTGMPINRHIREWLTEYEAATGDVVHKVFDKPAADTGEKHGG
jgi:hypothetical protein